MSTVEDQIIPTETVSVPAGRWKPEKLVFRVRVYLRSEDAGFSVRASNLPGVTSQGDNEQEALANITEACQGAIESYHAHGEEIPWSPSADTKDQDESERLVIVHA